MMTTFCLYCRSVVFNNTLFCDENCQTMYSIQMEEEHKLLTSPSSDKKDNKKKAPKADKKDLNKNK